jgi:hypothetical protein
MHPAFPQEAQDASHQKDRQLAKQSEAKLQTLSQQVQGLIATLRLRNLEDPLALASNESYLHEKISTGIPEKSWQTKLNDILEVKKTLGVLQQPIQNLVADANNGKTIPEGALVDIRKLEIASVLHGLLKKLEEEQDRKTIRVSWKVSPKEVQTKKLQNEVIEQLKHQITLCKTHNLFPTRARFEDEYDFTTELNSFEDTVLECLHAGQGDASSIRNRHLGYLHSELEKVDGARLDDLFIDERKQFSSIVKTLCVDIAEKCNEVEHLQDDHAEENLKSLDAVAHQLKRLSEACQRQTETPVSVEIPPSEKNDEDDYGMEDLPKLSARSPDSKQLTSIPEHSSILSDLD